MALVGVSVVADRPKADQIDEDWFGVLVYDGPHKGKRITLGRGREYFSMVNEPDPRGNVYADYSTPDIIQSTYKVHKCLDGSHIGFFQEEPTP